MVDADVLVVGAGPVGMTAALALAARGLTVQIIERRSGPADSPKAISLDDESLRLYQAAGIVDDVLAIVVPGTGTSYYDCEGRLLFDGRSPEALRYGYPFKNPFAQPDLERVLYSALRRAPGIDARFSTELLQIAGDGDAAQARISGPDGVDTVRARYVVAADGGRSTVRQQLGITMTGRSFDDVWLVVDTLRDTRRERYGMHHGDPRRPHVVVPGLNGRCRYEFLLTAEEAGEFQGEPPFELIQRLVASYRTITPDEVERAVTYRFHALNADTWRVGHVFLAGDAAHMMPPFAGQGLNSGLRDVANLVWKIEGVIRGRLDPAVLGSYEQERRPQVAAVIASSVALGRIVMTTKERVARHRDATIRRALTTPDGRAFFQQMRYRPAARFEVGMVVPGQDALVGTQIGQPTVFDFLRHRMVLLDKLLGSGWALLAVGLDGATITDASAAVPELVPRIVAVPFDDLVDDYPVGVEVAIDLDGRLYREFATVRGHFVLVRPDRFVAAVWLPGDEVDATIRHWSAPVGARPHNALRTA